MELSANISKSELCYSHQCNKRKTNTQKAYTQQIVFEYATEADCLNMALFGKTALQWRQENPATKGNIRDMASVEQLVVLSNMESMNAVMIQQGLSQSQRLTELNKMAITQIKSLLGSKTLKDLKNK